MWTLIWSFDLEHKNLGTYNFLDLNIYKILIILEIAVPGSAPGHLMASTPAIRSTPKTTAAQRFVHHMLSRKNNPEFRILKNDIF